MLIILIGLLGSDSVSADILQLQKGESCTALGGKLGSCKLLSKCATAGDFKYNQPPICSFKGKDIEPIICCPHNQVRTRKVSTGRKALKVCKELRAICRRELYPKDTIVIDAFIPTKNSSGVDGVSGIEFPSRGHPYMALIGFCSYEMSCDVTDASWGCSGSLISPRYILSAAHCVTPRLLWTAKWARLGGLDIGSGQPVDKRIVEILVYPKYSATQVYHDIALFKLDSDVVFNRYILPACLQTSREIRENKANFTGWVKTNFAGTTSYELLEGEMDIYTETECKSHVFNTNTPKAPLGFQPDLMICARIPGGRQDGCKLSTINTQGDSGSPLITGNEFSCLKTQIGITSFGHSNGLPNSPGVYTRVSNYISWIEDVAFKDVVI